MVIFIPQQHVLISYSRVSLDLARDYIIVIPEVIQRNHMRSCTAVVSQLATPTLLHMMEVRGWGEYVFHCSFVPYLILINIFRPPFSLIFQSLFNAAAMQSTTTPHSRHAEKLRTSSPTYIIHTVHRPAPSINVPHAHLRQRVVRRWRCRHPVHRGDSIRIDPRQLRGRGNRIHMA